MNVSYKTYGFDGLEAQLIAMAKDFGAEGYGKAHKSVLVPALKEAMKPVLTTARMFIRQGPYNELNTTSKHMLDTLRLTARQLNSKDRKSAYLHNDDVALAMVSVLTDDRGMSQEFGNARVPAQPYLRRSLEYAAPACLDVLEASLGRILAEYKATKTQDKIK